MERGNKLSKGAIKKTLKENKVDISVLHKRIKADLSWKELVNVRYGPTVVITDEEISKANMSSANTFSREISLNNTSNVYHHIGIYMYKVSTLEKFVNLKQTKNEIAQRLEQMRAIDNNIKINVILANSSPIGVDTEEDFLELKKIMNYKN